MNHVNPTQNISMSLLQEKMKQADETLGALQFDNLSSTMETLSLLLDEVNKYLFDQTQIVQNHTQHGLNHPWWHKHQITYIHPAKTWTFTIHMKNMTQQSGYFNLTGDLETLGGVSQTHKNELPLDVSEETREFFTWMRSAVLSIPVRSTYILIAGIEDLIDWLIGYSHTSLLNNFAATAEFKETALRVWRLAYGFVKTLELAQTYGHDTKFWEILYPHLCAWFGKESYQTPTFDPYPVAVAVVEAMQ